jgi:hypothetical protein
MNPSFYKTKTSGFFAQLRMTINKEFVLKDN